MDMMLLGEVVNADGSETNYYGFWMPAGGNDGVAAVEVFYVSGKNKFNVFLETKSSDDVDSAATTIGTVAISGVVPLGYQFDVTNAKDLVRYRVTNVGLTAVSMHLQFSQPLWSPN